ncbi:hypothetical protein ABZW18_26915 [Streptomyces sp. NPDC004647]|uniref:hypothetical protein n=1 Tax=Streptomyces sp. NPDC004647 TaxID=3154671 RepID=UPI0033BC36C8
MATSSFVLAATAAILHGPHGRSLSGSKARDTHGVLLPLADELAARGLRFSGAAVDRDGCVLLTYDAAPEAAWRQMLVLLAFMNAA